MLYFEAGEHYITRDGRRAEIVYVNEELKLFQQVGFKIQDENLLRTCHMTGEEYQKRPSPFDLVAEWFDDIYTLRLTEKDLGKIVKLRNGTLTIITAYEEGSTPIVTALGYDYLDNGRKDKLDATCYDIVEILGYPGE